MVESIIKQVSNNPKKDDKIANLVGHFGKWQFMVFSSVILVKLSSGWVQMAILFLTPSLKFWCAEFAPNSTEYVLNLTEHSAIDSAANYAEYSAKNLTLLEERSTCYQDCLKYEFDTRPFDNTIISEWNLVCERRWLASFTQMVLQFGILAGSIIFGFLSDRYGRKNTFLAAVTIMVAFGFGIPYSPTYLIFTLQRFFLGCGAAGTMVISFVIVIETVGPQYRELLGCLFQIPFIIGHMTVPIFGYYFRSWDTYTLAMAVPQLIYIGYFFILNESPRWLVSVGRVDEATRILKKAAVMNNRPTAKIEETLKILAQDIQSTSSQPKANYSDLFHRSLRCKTICCCIMWLVTGVTYFGVNQYISDTSPDPFVSVAAAGAMQIPSTLMVIWLIKRLGRKKTAMGLFLLGGACILALGYVPKIYWLILTLGSLGVSCAGGMASTLYIYTTELYPTVVRNMGMGVCSTTMRAGSMIAPFLSSLSLSVPWLPTLVFGLAPIGAGMLCLFLPETKGRTLPDTIDELKSGD